MVRGSLLAGAVVLFALAPPAAVAQEDYVGAATEVKSNELSRPAAAPAAAAQEADPDDDDDRIPITGGDVAGLALLGLGSIAMGAALTRRSRRPA
ncbi:MAG TPA: hypothetical protein VHF47_01505 [Acidimicrobiales bacterium]|nr:hypothetical protein [Acidimicrobiales bacterium]